MTEYTPTTDEVRDRWGRDAISENLRPEWLAEFDRWFAERDRQVAERAWDEGYRQGWGEGYRQGWGDRHEDFHAGYVPSGFDHDTQNPYRKAE